MSRPASTLILAATLLASGLAHADETSWGMGIASIYIGSATPYLNLSVQNLSGSSDPEERELVMTSPMPEYELSGQVFCDAILGGTTELKRAQLMFGHGIVMSSQGGGTTLWPTDMWDASEPQLFGGVTAADVDFQHELDIPTTWQGGPITLGFNPVEVVEKRLADYVTNGGTAADFLRTDDVFEVEVGVNLVGVCENTSDYGVNEYVGYTRRYITVAIFFHGDENIEDPITQVGGLPGDIAVGSSSPLLLKVRAPLSPRVSRVLASREEEPPTGREYVRYNEYDPTTSSYLGLWSGWVTPSEDDTCYEHPVTAVTPDGRCVLVDEGCVPASFGRCAQVTGCCQAPLPLDDGTRLCTP
jgi:hypothetical protein